MLGNRSGAAENSVPQPISFFDLSPNRLITFLSFAIPLLIILAFVFTGPKVSDAGYRATRVFLGLAFLNTSHIVLTVLLMSCLPEFRAYLNEKGRSFFEVLGVMPIVSIPLLSLRGNMWNGYPIDLLFYAR